MIEIIVMCFILGIFIIYSFIKGIQIGQCISKNENIKIKGPMEIVRNYKENQEYQKEKKTIQEIDEINLNNIDNYNGSSDGQKEFPKNK